MDCASWSNKRQFKSESFQRDFIPKSQKKCKNLTKIHFFEILTVFWLFLVNEWSWNLKIWPCFTSFCPLANWFEVLPLGTFPSIQSGPRSGPDCFSSPYLPPPSAAAHPALPKSGGAEGAQKKEETLSYRMGYIRASNSF